MKQSNPSNPLLSTEHFPLFEQVLASHVEPAIQTIIKNNQDGIKELLSKTENPTWENLVETLDKLEVNLHNAWSTISHLNSVKDTPEFRKAHDAALITLTEYYTELGQNEELYKAFLALEKSDHFKSLNADQQKVIHDELRDFKLAGVGLSPEKKAIYKELSTQLSELESQFEHNALDATQGWDLLIEDIDQLKGMPNHALESTKEAAKKKGLKGWLLTLDFSTYFAVMGYVENRDLRKTLYEASCTRASEVGPNAGKWDNSPLMEQLLQKRQQLAKLLDFNNYAEYSLAKKMAKDTKTVMDFLLDLAKRSKPMAEKEIQEIKDFGAKHFGIQNIESWDVPFLREKLCKELHQISQEELRPYFPEPVVVSGLFEIVTTLFGITFEEVKQFETWDPLVRLFKVFDKDGGLRGHFYVDLYSRAGKREGAWVSDCRNRVKWADGTIQTPIAFLNANFSPPEGNKPGLLTHDDVITLFHEFGHCLHHVVTIIDYASISGNHGVEWDAIELPSQLLENWCWEFESIQKISSNIDTKKPIPQELFKKLKDTKIFMAGMDMVRQLEFSLFDFDIHLHPEVTTISEIRNVLSEVRKTVSVFKPPEYNRFPNTFSHIFGGSYAAGYYSYKWAEVLSSDVFEVFEQQGIFNQTIGKKLLNTILELGASKKALDLFVAFRGREPKIDALLRHSGLTST